MKAIDKFILHVVHNWKNELNEAYGKSAIENFIKKFREEADDLNISITDQQLKSYPSDRTPPTITTKLLKHIVSIDGDEDRVKISIFVDQMPISDSKYIRRFVFDNEPRLDLSKEVIAPSGEKVPVLVDFGVEFFRPFYGI